MNTRVWTGIVLAGATAWLGAGIARAQSTTMQSVDSAGLWGSTDSSSVPLARLPALSGDGRYIVFTSDAVNFVPGDLLPGLDVFVHDRQGGTTECVSVGPAGTPTAGDSMDGRISADGRFVVFYSSSSTLVAPDTNGTWDIFVRDRVNGTTTIASVSTAGVQGNLPSASSTISADGRCVAFSSNSTNLVPGYTGIFLRDLVAHTTEAVSVDFNGGPASNSSGNVSLSADGKFACYWSGATDIVASDVNGRVDIFLRDRALAVNELISVDSAGNQSNGESWLPAISGDGRYVAYESVADNLVPGDTNGVSDVFLRDRILGTTTRVSVDFLGRQGNDFSGNASISADGRFVTFTSVASNLVPSDTNGVFDVFVHDLVSGSTERVSTAWNGDEADGNSAEHATSADGRYVAFASEAGNLVPLDNAAQDVYVVDRALVATPMQRYCTAKTNSIGCSPAIGATGAPLATGFDSFFLIAYRVLPNKSGILFWGTSPAALPFGGGTLCVQPPIVRTPVQASQPAVGTTACDNLGSYSFHFRQSYMSQTGLAAGDTVYAQFWSRDPGFSPPGNIGLTDALRFTICN